MEDGENYRVFGIASAMTGCWHAGAQILIFQNQAAGAGIPSHSGHKN